MKKLISGLLALAMCLPMVGQVTDAAPLQVVAADQEAVTVDGLTYELDSSGRATLTGVADTSLTSITIPAEVNGYEVRYVKQTGIFSECRKLEEINTEDTVDRKLCSIDGVLFYGSDLAAYPRAKKDTAYTIPDGITTLDNYAFYGAENLKSLKLAESVNRVDVNTFGENPLLEEIAGEIPSTKGVMFTHCASLKSLTFAEAKPGKESFLPGLVISDCPSLETIAFPETLKVSVRFVLLNCGIKNLTVDFIDCNEITIVGCENLETLSLNPAIRAGNRTEISDCPNLKYIYAEKIGDMEVTECPALTSIGLKGVSGIYIENCPELTALKLYDRVDIDGFYRVEKLTVYGTWFTSTGVYEKYGVPYAPMETNPGDANDDGAFNLMDAVILQKHLLNAGRVTYWKNCDFNGDGKVNVIDLVLMKRALLG